MERHPSELCGHKWWGKMLGHLYFNEVRWDKENGFSGDLDAFEIDGLLVEYWIMTYWIWKRTELCCGFVHSAISYSLIQFNYLIPFLPLLFHGTILGDLALVSSSTLSPSALSLFFPFLPSSKPIPFNHTQQRQLECLLVTWRSFPSLTRCSLAAWNRTILAAKWLRRDSTDASREWLSEPPSGSSKTTKKPEESLKDAVSR